MKKATWIVLGLVAFGCIGVFALSGGDDDKPSPVVATAVPEGAEAPADTPAEAPAATEAPADAPAAAKIGDTVAVGESYAWTITGVEDKGQEIDTGNEYIDNPTTTGRFLLVATTIKNTGKDSFYIDAPKVVDASGREFDAHPEATSAGVDDASTCVLEKVNPGLDRPCAWIYELPADATGLKAKVGGALFDTAVEVDLGQ